MKYQEKGTDVKKEPLKARIDTMIEKATSKDLDVLLGCSGADNMGNTCYMNSIIQCLSNCPRLKEYLTSSRYIRDLTRGTDVKTERETVVKCQKHLGFQLRKLFSYFWNFDGREQFSWQPTSFRRLFGSKIQYFQNSAQHDSQEAFICIIDTLHEEVASPSEIKRVDDHIYKTFKFQDEHGVIDQKLIDQNPEKYFYYISTSSYEYFYTKKYSEIVKILRGMTISEMKCPITNRSSHRLTPEFCFSLSIPTDDQIIDNEASTSLTARGITPKKSTAIVEYKSPKATPSPRPAPSPDTICAGSDSDDLLHIPEDDDSDSDYHVMQCEWEEEDDDIGDITFEEEPNSDNTWGYYKSDFKKKIKFIINDKLPKEATFFDDGEIWSLIKPETRFKILQKARELDDDEMLPDYEFNHLSKSKGITVDTTYNKKSAKQQYIHKPHRLRPLTVYDCLNHFINPEVLDDNNKWRSPFAKEDVNATKTLMLWDVPEIFVVHFKHKLHL